MLVLITYDVNTETASGKKRLRQVAKQCVNYGIRVQNSVFECKISSHEMILFKEKLLEIIDEETDSLRFYYLGKSYKTKIEHYGKDLGYNVDDTLIL
ncbi:MULTISPECIES: CRISPR-associated endonuclease Cas2 [Faecalicoccus]|uniref:CRISPR-associated endoribonuclease Cas2 n=1 Tax=Faecalicoccus pleomorphus TaxID=1323 RepID=A0AAW6CTM1_9FIRM|nr:MULTISPECIES: CRISPR-associated endonuclease Cas2 [Faecalicoccus]MDB7980736.1 CRISPR-associated endonuclease Cas2 [Faecalicoccus pleomorphus]MDB7982943.1 CRISPR-associated endonuclease Cas2 [Faecalicoccus pleomorphus]MDY4869800.1 CRISPR-associated endonuclease Cas2 [Faecalicoccus sp.]MDY5232637.1 CRISPR-associated endonuclease Cas2 [Faecalicoccus sp.]